LPEDPLEIVREYHERTKHHLNRYARSLGYLDWANQPDPFRRYRGAHLIGLEHPPASDEPLFDQLVDPSALPARPLDRRSVSQLFYDSLALSAWKQAGGSRWALRVNPSSGNLHPTEGYLVAGPIEGLTPAAGVYHYAPREHGLEVRRTLTDACWQSLSRSLPGGALLVGLTSIYWREAWKYGERAFRYCQHDVGHAVAAIAYAAAALGWRTRLLESVNDDDLAQLLGVDGQTGPDAEHPDCLLVVYPAHTLFRVAAQQQFTIPTDVRAALERASPNGEANALSGEHCDWPVIDEVGQATHRPPVAGPPPVSCRADRTPHTAAPTAARPLSARQMIRQRRSAVELDGTTRISRQDFYRILQRVCPQRVDVPFAASPWQPAVHLVLLVHRVDGVPPGAYLLVRRPEALPALRSALGGKSQFVWRKPPQCPESIPLYQLLEADARQAARTISCHQDIAADGVFAVGMLAEFEPRLSELGPWFYKRLFWETGMIGQTLYLEAEAAGIRGTGIGCFFDDSLHQLIGLSDRRYQSLYHFTLGGPVDDPRLQTLPPYEHLGR
jgi:SagB-type dehydrogenase family enzyme